MTYINTYNTFQPAWRDVLYASGMELTPQDIANIRARYEERHGVGPYPYAIPEEEIVRVLLEHMETGVPEDYQWWGYLPPGADA